MYSIQQMDLTLLQQDLQNFGGRSKLGFLCPKWIFDRDFALAGEIINDNRFLFYAVFLI